MTADPILVIVGASLAGAKAAEGARNAGFDGRIALVGEEQALPYERPPLSKTVLRGEAGHETTYVHDKSFYDTHDIELHTGRTVDALDAENQRVRLDGAEWLPYTAAVLATGSSPRRLALPGAELAGVHYLRTLSDSKRLGDAIRGSRRVAVIGAGWIGSEVAASARQMGADVVLIEPAPVPLHRVLGDEVGQVFSRLHADNGVTLRLGTGVMGLHGKNSVSHIALTDGTVEPADVVVVGVGVTPRVELAAAAGLKVDNGIVVDEYLQSSTSGIYAAGDVASAWHPHHGRQVRVEHWFNAIHQGLTAGANAVGSRTPYTELPYFFSDQYDLGMEYVGLSQPGDQVTVRGSLADREFIAFWHRDGTVTAAMNVNVWDVVDDLRAIVSNRCTFEPALLADPSIDLAELAATGRDTARAEELA
jgi:3-phenylpropionate/trans-cinnamate dioxygenase ferredoxin reductase subunit